MSSILENVALQKIEELRKVVIEARRSFCLSAIKDRAECVCENCKKFISIFGKELCNA